MKHETFKYNSPVGDIYCVFDGPFLVELSIGEEEAMKQAGGYRQGAIGKGKSGNSRYSIPVASRLSPIACAFFEELASYFDGTLREFKQKVRFTQGTAFERSVWLALRDIPYGETRTYKWMAGKIGRPKALRATGRALGKNPLPIVLPCHRIIASNGSMCGFSGGVEVKIWLLRHEKKDI
ncbi:MAG: methylated-DNA--[protein]-cysteine S-methyltransferase [Nitrospirae bacterium]|nr:methylated-DNA--[protein]-cysteine S-methyltransferase [Nitrospirota bacterium]